MVKHPECNSTIQSYPPLGLPVHSIYWHDARVTREEKRLQLSCDVRRSGDFGQLGHFSQLCCVGNDDIIGHSSAIPVSKLVKKSCFTVRW